MRNPHRRYPSPHRTFALIMALFMLALVFVPTKPVQAQSLPIGFTTYFPADTPIYATMRTDPAFVQQLDAVYATLVPPLSRMAGLPPGQVPRSFQGLLNMLTVQAFNSDYAGVRSWLGNQVAIGLSPNRSSGDDWDILIAVELVDTETAIQFFEEKVEGLPERLIEGDYTVFDAGDTRLAFGQNRLFLSNNPDRIPIERPENNLSFDGLLMDTISLLPGDNYAMLLYADSSALIDATEAFAYAAPEEMMGLELLQATGPIAIGVSIEDGQSLVIDLVQDDQAMGAEMPLNLAIDAAAISPAFWNHIPDNASLVMHSTNLKGVYDLFIGLLRSTSMPTIDKTTAQLEEQLKAMIGLSFHDDLLSWLTGNYAVFARYETDPEQPSLLSALIRPNQEISSLGIDVGVVIEAVDPAKAQNLVNTLAPLFTVMLANQEGVSAVMDTVAGANALVISLDANLPLSLVMAANDNVLVIGTYDAAVAALSGTGGFASAPRFIEAQRGMLSDPSALVFADQSVLVFLADMTVLGPAIDTIFGRILAELNGVPYDEPRPGERDVQRGEIAQAMRQVREVAALFNSATLSAQINDDGTNRLRFTLTLRPQ